jgi:hypothetical protein
MLTRPQQILLKRAQSQAGIDDGEYRDSLELLSALPGCRSSKDSRITDGHLDNLLAYFEAIYWKRVDAGELQQAFRADAVFRQRGFWASKNTKGNTSRDRYVAGTVGQEIAALEQQLVGMGNSLAYLRAIQNNTRAGGMLAYKAALERTLKAKQNKEEQVGV